MAWGFTALGDAQHGHRGGAAEGFVVGGTQFLQEVLLIVRELDDLVRDAEQFRGFAGLGRFIFRVAGSADSEGGDVGVELRRSPADQRRIDAAAEQGADWHVGV